MLRFNRSLGALSALVVLAFVVPAAQERVKPKGPADFKTLHAEVGTDFAAGRFATCLAKLRDLTIQVTDAFEAKVLEHMPAAPEGYTKVVPKKEQANPNNAMAAAFKVGLGGLGNVIEQRYTPAEGRKELVVTVTSDSPMLQLFGMWIANPAMLGPDAELIKYEGADAVLQKENAAWVLRIKLGNDLIEARGPGDELLLKLLSQANLDRLRSALDA